MKKNLNNPQQTDYSSIVNAEPVILNDNIILGEYISRQSRSKFISKVYTILYFQLVITVISMGIFINIPVVNNFIKTNMLSQVLLNVCFWILLCVNCMFVCLYESFNKTPYKELYLFTFTSCMSYIMGYMSVYFDTINILLAGISTMTIVGGLTLYAYQTKYDFTMMGGSLICMMFALILFGILSTFFAIPMANLIYSIGGTFIFSLFIIHDTQMIVGGKHRRIQFRENDTILAATSLYIDVINMFLCMLDIISGRN